MAHELSLGDAVRQIALSIDENGLAIPFRNESLWHLLFYRLKKHSRGPKPAFLKGLRFDSDGHFPRSRELSEFLQGLHTACTVDVLNPSYEAIVLPEDATSEWAEEKKALDKKDKEFLAKALALAKKEFPQKQAVNA